VDSNPCTLNLTYSGPQGMGLFTFVRLAATALTFATVGPLATGSLSPIPRAERGWR
jgi:hypothetical protein